MARNVQLQIIRGSFVNMPSLSDGEFYLSTDTNQLFVGLGGNNLLVGVSMSNIVTLGDTNKTVQMKTGQLTTTAVTANQIALTYTVTVGKNLFLEYIDIQARLTAVSATSSVLGTAVLQINGVSVYTATFVNPTTSDQGSQAVRLFFSEPVPIPSAQAIAVLVTPAAATSMLWTANFGGYER
jgi:hypothetical protein